MKVSEKLGKRTQKTDPASLIFRSLLKTKFHQNENRFHLIKEIDNLKMVEF